MFRIHNQQELERLALLLENIRHKDMRFPVDIYRSASEVSAMEYGVYDEQSFAFTVESQPEYETSQAHPSYDYRTYWQNEEKQYAQDMMYRALPHRGMLMLRLKPTMRNVIVWVAEPVSAQAIFGEVLSVGSLVTEIQPGQSVIFGKYSGKEIFRVEEGILTVVDPDDLLAIVDIEAVDDMWLRLRQQMTQG